MAKTKSPLKAGQQARVFEDPVTCEKFEATVTLLENLDNDMPPSLEYWRVRFSDGQESERWVNTREC